MCKWFTVSGGYGDWVLGAKRLPGGGLKDIYWHKSNVSLFPDQPYFAWGTNQPDNHGIVIEGSTPDCIVIWQGIGYKFFDRDCKDPKSFICELEIYNFCRL